MTVNATVVNSGDATLSQIGVIDAEAGNLSCKATTLSAGVQTFCTGQLHSAIHRRNVL